MFHRVIQNTTLAQFYSRHDAHCVVQQGPPTLLVEIFPTQLATKRH